VLVNDFGALPIDADLIEAQDGETIAIAGGCVCCSFGSDLVAGLRQLAARDPAPDHLLIEASGVALPAAIAATVSLVSGYANDGVVVLADAETVRERAADRYLGDTVERQLRDAGLVLLTKPDLAEPASRAATRTWLENFAPVVEVERGRVPLELLLGPGAGKSSSGFARAPAHPAYETAEFECLPALDLERLAAALTNPALGILRAKGMFQDLSGATRVLNVVGLRSEITDEAYGAAGRFVCIGLKGRLNRETLERLFARS